MSVVEVVLRFVEVVSQSNRVIARVNLLDLTQLLLLLYALVLRSSILLRELRLLLLLLSLLIRWEKVRTAPVVFDSIKMSRLKSTYKETYLLKPYLSEDFSRTELNRFNEPLSFESFSRSRDSEFLAMFLSIAKF